jgi:hypothetical protein
MKKKIWYEYEILSVFKQISINMFLLTKRAPALGYIYITALTRQIREQEDV